MVENAYCEAVWDVKQSKWPLCVSSGGCVCALVDEPGIMKFWLSSYILPWRSMSVNHQNHRDLNQCVLHLLSEFGDFSLYTWWFFPRTSSGFTNRNTDARTRIRMHGHTDTRTHRQTGRRSDSTRRPKVTSGENQIYRNKHAISFDILCTIWERCILMVLSKLASNVKYFNTSGRNNYFVDSVHVIWRCPPFFLWQ